MNAGTVNGDISGYWELMVDVDKSMRGLFCAGLGSRWIMVERAVGNCHGNGRRIGGVFASGHTEITLKRGCISFRFITLIV